MPRSRTTAQSAREAALRTWAERRAAELEQERVDADRRRTQLRRAAALLGVLGVGALGVASSARAASPPPPDAAEPLDFRLLEMRKAIREWNFVAPDEAAADGFSWRPIRSTCKRTAPRRWRCTAKGKWVTPDGIDYRPTTYVLFDCRPIRQVHANELYYTMQGTRAARMIVDYEGQDAGGARCRVVLR